MWCESSGWMRRSPGHGHGHGWWSPAPAAPQQPADRWTERHDIKIRCQFSTFYLKRNWKKKKKSLSWTWMKGAMFLFLFNQECFNYIILSVRHRNKQWAIHTVEHIKQENSQNARAHILILCFLEMYFGLQRINQRFKFSTSPVAFMSDLIT